MRYFTVLHVSDVQLQRVARHLQEIVRRVGERHIQATNTSSRRAQIFLAEKNLHGARAILPVGDGKLLVPVSDDHRYLHQGARNSAPERRDRRPQINTSILPTPFSRRRCKMSQQAFASVLTESSTIRRTGGDIAATSRP